MSTCETNNNENNGFITSVWGSSCWTLCHIITLNYPIKPTDSDKEKYKNFFTLLGNVLPCKYCRDSYQKFIVTDDTVLDDSVMVNRESLSKWFYRVHERVNSKLCVDYGVTYDEMVKKYETARAVCSKTTDDKGCVVSMEYKANAYKNIAAIDPPLISLDDAEDFIELAKRWSVDEKYFCFIKFARHFNGNIEEMKKHPLWEKRRQLCHDQITYMRHNAIKSIEDDGLPTINELGLILFMSSNLNKEQLNQVKKKMKRYLYPNKN